MHGQSIAGALWLAGRLAASLRKHGAIRDARGNAGHGTNVPASLDELPSSRHLAGRLLSARAGIAALMSLTAATLCAPQQAKASIITTTVTGTVAAGEPLFAGVTSGIDTTGVFGAAGASLVGDPFALVYTIDYTKGTQTTINDANGVPFFSEIHSAGARVNNQLGNINPITSAVLTITGHSYSFGTFQGNFPLPGFGAASSALRDLHAGLSGTSQASFSLDEAYSGSNNTGGFGQIGTSILFNNPPATPSYLWSSPLSYTLNSPVNPLNDSGNFGIARTDTNQIAAGELLPTRLVVTAGQAQPPPVRSLFLAVNTGPPNSQSGDPTVINGFLTLATTAPNQPYVVQLPPIFPSTDSTLQQAAQDLYFTGFNWISIADDPSPRQSDSDYSQADDQGTRLQRKKRGSSVWP